MLREQGLFEYRDKVQEAVDLLKKNEPDDGYFLAFSGGKDSVVIHRLAEKAGVQFDSHYSVTTIDPPELVYFIREHYPDVDWIRPKEPFVQALVKNGFPQRQRRWCCSLYKEQGGTGRLCIMGVRAAESANRAKRKPVEEDRSGAKRGFVNPILYWKDEDVWEFIKKENLPYCSLYDEGWKRIGCMMCPFAGTKKRVMEAERYPGFRDLFIKAFVKMHAKKKSEGKTSVDRWASGEEMFWWWIGRDFNYEDPRQELFFDDLKGDRNGRAKDQR